MNDYKNEDVFFISIIWTIEAKSFYEDEEIHLILHRFLLCVVDANKCLNRGASEQGKNRFEGNDYADHNLESDFQTKYKRFVKP